MRKLAALLAGAMLMMATSAMAIPTYAPDGSGTAALWLNSGTSDVVVYDNGFGDSNLALGRITYIGDVGSSFIDVSFGTTKPAVGSTSSPTLALNNSTVSGASGTINMAFTDTFFGPLPTGFGGFSLNAGGTQLGGASVSVSSLLSTSNTPWSGDSLINLGPFTTGSFSGYAQTSVPDYTGPFALTLETSVTFPSADGIALISATLQPVPEPGTMVLLGFGMLGLAIYGKRRMNNKEA